MKKNNSAFYILAFCLLGLLTLTYSNHFHNGFHFDDSHSLVNNIYIRDLKNIPLFFTDGQTLSSLPANQAYRPLMPLLYAIDYKLGHGLDDTFQFHLTTFLFYMAQCILLFFLFKKLFELSKPGTWNSWLALFAASWYGFHTANAETINYISARSDSISTFFVVAGMVAYLYSARARKWHLYLLPIILGILVKPAAIVFPGLLFFYLLFFDLSDKKRPDFISQLKYALIYFIPSLLICAGLYLFQAHMTPATFVPGGSRFTYLISQPFVTLHYFKNFFLPNDLSADTDWQTIPNMINIRFAAGMLFILLMLILAFFTWRKKEARPISFGILWFFIALIPSSSIIPFAEVMNDHRTFFPYIGLAIAVTWSVGLLLQKITPGSPAASNKIIMITCALIILSANAWGTFERNKLWKNDELLWKDVTVKSPANGRGHLNYGLALMQKGDLEGAEKEYLIGLKNWPYYSYLHVNMGVLKSAQNKNTEAESYFKNGLNCGFENPEAYYYYANFLCKMGRKKEAIPYLENCVRISPAHIQARYLLMDVYLENYKWDELQRIAEETLNYLSNDPAALNYLAQSKARQTRLDLALKAISSAPTPENYLDLSLEYYKVKQFEKCIEAAQEALKKKNNYVEAWNNIGSAYNQLGKFDEAEQACLKALEIKPDYELAKNNLIDVRNRRDNINTAMAVVKSKADPQNYLLLSLAYYNAGVYDKCIEACKEALKLNPNFAEAWNNICSAYNQMQDWDNAIKAGEEALKISPDLELAKNNLNFAIQQKTINQKK